GDAIADDGARWSSGSRRLARTAGRSHEPRWSAALDSLAGPADPGPAGGRQHLLHGLSICCAANFSPPFVAFQLELAAKAAEQVAGGTPAGIVPVGLRGIRPVGQSLVDGMACPGLLRIGLCDRWI